MTEQKTTTFRVIWQMIMFICAWFTAFDTPLMLVLRIPIGTFHITADILISVLFCVDIYFNYVLFPKIRRKEVAEEPLIEHMTYSHSKKFLPYDIISCIPFDLMSYIFGQTFGAGVIANSIRFFKVARIIRLYHIYQIVKKLAILPRWVKLSGIFFTIILSIHIIACGWLGIYPNNGAEDLATFYNKGLYWAITTLTTIGYGDITPTSNVGRIYTMAIMLLGVGLYGVVIGNVSTMLVAADRHKEASREKLLDINMFMKHYGIPNHLQKQVLHFYHHLLQKRLSENDATIISELPNALQLELQIYMKMRLISSVPIFQGQATNCLKMLSSHLEQKFYSPGDIIVEKGEQGNEMYIIGHGQVEVMLEDNKPIATLHEGECFGETALLQETVRSNDVRSKGYSDLYILDKESFIKVINKFPKLKKNFDKLIADRTK